MRKPKDLRDSDGWTIAYCDVVHGRREVHCANPYISMDDAKRLAKWLPKAIAWGEAEKKGIK